MTTNYPTGFDGDDLLLNELIDPSSTAAEGPLDTSHAELHNHISDAIIAIETELGTAPRGSYASLVARLADLLALNPTANQIIQPTGDFTPIVLWDHAGGNGVLLEVRDVDNNVVGSWDNLGIVDASALSKAGTALNSSHFTNVANIILLNSPSITTPTLASPNFSGSPVAPTPATGDDSTTVATTAFVIAQTYAKAASPALIDNPTVPTPVAEDDTTKIATTAYVVDAIAASEPEDLPVGTIFAYGGSSAPTGWLLCDGSTPAQATYPTLYALLGTTYGVDSGGNFTLPDLRGRIPVGLGTHADVNALNDNDGVGTVSTRRPKHSHGQSLSLAATGHNHDGGSSGGGGSHSHTFAGGSGSTGVVGAGGNTRAVATGIGTGSAGSHSHSFTSDSLDHTHGVGGSIGLSGMTDASAYLVVNYIIKH